MAMFHLLKIRTSIDIFKNEKCTVTFGLEFIYILIFDINMRVKFAFQSTLKTRLSVKKTYSGAWQTPNFHEEFNRVAHSL